MKLAIMQPYFLPYIGYFQLIDAVDLFVVYDNIKYTKKGWINRNRMLLNGSDLTFSIPLKKGSDSLSVVERELAADFNRNKLVNQFRAAYSRAPYFPSVFPLLEQIVQYEENNLFKFIHNSIKRVCDYLRIDTEIRIASTVNADHQLKGQDRVLAICEALGCDTYVNPIGGTGLYSTDAFKAHGIDLRFLESQPFEYAQFDNQFLPWLSIVDVMMFNSIDDLRCRLKDGYAIISKAS